ncbi:MAG: DNA alkylation repair protein [Myxococcota bacterium]|nr:DNA alkylation repair protein [Myxococcota bacterium]
MNTTGVPNKAYEVAMTKQFSVKTIQKEFRALGDEKIAEHSKGFFKTGKGQYGEGDKFLGIRMPVIRKQAKGYGDCSLEQVSKILESPYHEERMLAVVMLVDRFKNADEEGQKTIYDIYLGNAQYVNGWDLVDISAPPIAGGYLENRDRSVLYELAKSTDLWKRRIAIVATFFFIRRNDFKDVVAISTILRDDSEDLIHKAVGWMLREMGKRDMDVERKFLKKNYRKMPRTMLRYAIEKFPEDERQGYLRGVI